MDWLILCVLVPAVILPAVLLWGFAGCYNPRELAPSTTPINLTAIPLNLSEILVSWENTSPIVYRFQVFRAKEGEAFAMIQDQAYVANPIQTFHDSIGLEEGNTYLYQVNSYYNDSFSEPSAPAIAYFFFRSAFSTTLATPQPAVHGFCLVQKLGKDLFTTDPFSPISGKQVRITVRGAPGGPLTIDRVYISRVAPSGDPYDPLNAGPPDQPPVPGRLTKVVDRSLGDPPVVLAAGESRILGPVDFDFDHTQDLLIAFDINGTAGQDNVVRNGQVVGAVSYAKAAIEAAAPDRTAGYLEGPDNVYLVEKLEVL